MHPKPILPNPQGVLFFSFTLRGQTHCKYNQFSEFSIKRGEQ